MINVKMILILSAGVVGLLFFQNCAQPELALAPEPPKTISLIIENYCPVDGHTFNEVFALNRSAQINKDHFIADFDRDGLSDELELDVDVRDNYNINVSSNDTNGDYYSDLINISLGYDSANQFRLSPCASNYNDTDLDGLTDCEEMALGTNKLDPDTDQDGIPDGLEINNNLNPKDPIDSRSDLDGDGLTNLQEIKKNTSIKFFNNIYVNNIALQYGLETYINGSSDECYTLTISNIPIMEVTNGNYIRVYLMESYTQVGGTSSEEVREIQQVNVIVDRLVIDKTEIYIQKDNSKRQQLETVNLDEL